MIILSYAQKTVDLNSSDQKTLTISSGSINIFMLIEIT